MKKKRASQRRSRRNRIRRRSVPGAPPGTLMPDPASPTPVIRVMAYGPGAMEEATLPRIADARAILDRHPVVWINIDGLGDAAVLREIGAFFNLHPLVLEDVINTHQRPKLEPYGDSLYIVLRELMMNGRVENDQLSLVFARNYVISFQEKPGDCFDPVRARIRDDRSLFRTHGPDYLLYALMDATIDSYFPIIEHLGEVLEDAEESILTRPSPTDVAIVHGVKRDLLHLRRAAWPLREVLNSMIRDGNPLISAEVRTFLRDCHDHAVQILDLVETDREMCSDLMDVYLSSISHRMNQVMKLLTIMSTIFIPLTFLAGVYGMNFQTEAGPWSMPELLWKHGYLAFWAACFLIALSLLLLFWRLGWLGGADEKPLK